YDRLTQALALLGKGQPEEVARCQMALGNTAESLRNLEAALGWYRKAEALLAKSGGRAEALIAAHRGVGSVLLGPREDTEALQAYEKALKAVEQVPDPRRRAELRSTGLANLGFAHQTLGRPERAGSLYEQALAVRNASGFPTPEFVSACRAVGSGLVV